MKELPFLTHSVGMNDTLLLRGRSINIGRNETMKELPCWTHSVGIRSNTNVVIVCAPHRFNLETKGVRVFNRKLQQSMKIFTYVQVINIRIDNIPNMVYREMDFVKTGLLAIWPQKLQNCFHPKRLILP